MSIKGALVIAILSTTALATSAATAQSTTVPNKISVGYQHDDGGRGIQLPTIAVRYTHSLTDYIAAEGEITRGIASDSVQVGNEKVTVKSKFGVGAYLVARRPVWKNGSDIFFRVGYENLDVNTSSPSFKSKRDEDGFAYGIGSNIMFNEKNGVRVDYTRYKENTDSVGISYVRAW